MGIEVDGGQASSLVVSRPRWLAQVGGSTPEPEVGGLMSNLTQLAEFV